MKFYIFTILSTIYVLPLTAQESTNNFTFFNKILAEDTAVIVANAVMPTENSYLVIGLWADVNNTNNRAIFLTKLETNGEVVWTKFLDHSNTVSIVQSGNAFIRDVKNPNHYLVIYSKYRDITRKNLDVAVTKFTADGTVLWTQLNGDENKQSPFTIINTNDGGYFATGWQQIDANPITSYVLKLDSLGNEQWSNTYTLDTIGHCATRYALQTTDNGYVLSGYGEQKTFIEVFNTSIIERNMYFFKIDASGNVEWEQNYGTEWDDWGCQISQLEEENFLLSSAKNKGNTKKYIAKLNNTGDIIWDREHAISNAAYITTPIYTTEDGGLLGFTTTFTESLHWSPLLIRYDSRGDTLWTNPITPDSSNDVYIRDMEATPDGGYIIAGFNYTHTPQYGWIAKIDSLGNTCWSSLDCDSTAIITNIPQLPTQNPYQVQINPNPVKDFATVSYQLPLDGRLQLYDLQGRWIREWWLPAVVESMPLEVGELEGGLYIYKVSIEGREVDSGKLLIE